jgi:hypothetical protein
MLFYKISVQTSQRVFGIDLSSFVGALAHDYSSDSAL